jgi:lipopolysaccharide export LptBFGC system permease protein LptF
MPETCPSTFLNSTPREIAECAGDSLRSAYTYVVGAYSVVTTSPGQATVGQWLLAALAAVVAIYIIAVVIGALAEDVRAQREKPPQPPFKLEYNKRLTVPLSVMALCVLASIVVGYTHPDYKEGVRSICAVVGFIAYLVTCSRAAPAQLK